MSSLVRVTVRLSDSQARRLMAGHRVNLRAQDLAGSDHVLWLHPETAKRLAKAKRGKVGARLELTKQEAEMSGEGLKEFFQSIGRFYKEKIRPVVGPIIRQGLQGVAQAAASSFGPKVGEIEAKYGPELIAKLGDATGAFGLAKRSRKPRASKVAAMPVMSCPSCGGSFRAV